MEGRYWEENGHTVKYENYTNTDDGFRSGDGHLNFSTGVHSDDEADYPPGSYLKKTKQDPMSHRIIEKRRRDRMNNCLADLSRLIPPHYLKKGRGRVEKTEIIEMAIRHLKYLQDKPTPSERVDTSEQWGAGYQECLGEAARFMMREQRTPGDGVCLQLVAHLQKHYETRVKGTPVSREAHQSSFASNGLRGGVIRHPARYEPYAMDSDKGEMQTVSEESGTSAVDSGASTELEARVSSPHPDDHPSYKFKNCIGRRFSRSQDTEYCQAQDMSVRRSCPKPPSVDDSAQQTQLVPIFALHSDGKYYVPLSVRDAHVSRHVAARASAAPLHSVSLLVRFSSCGARPEPSEPDWLGEHN